MKLSPALSLLALAAVVMSQSQRPLSIVKSDSLKVPGENNLEYCEEPSGHILTIHSVSLTPNPPQAGKPLSIDATGDLSEPVEEGSTAHVTVKVNFISLLNKYFDVCENIHFIDEECPLPKGPVNVTKQVDIPGAVPDGRYKVQAEAWTKPEKDGGKKITCMKGDITFGNPWL